MQRDPALILLYLLECWSELMKGESYPTNHQMCTLLQSVSRYPPLLQYFPKLTDNGKIFWTDLKRFLEECSSLIKSKNHNEVLQSALYHLQLARQSREEGVVKSSGSTLIWILFLLLTSNSFKEMAQEGSILLATLFPSAKTPNYLRNSIQHLGPDPMHGAESPRIPTDYQESGGVGHHSPAAAGALQDLLSNENPEVGTSPSPERKESEVTATQDDQKPSSVDVDVGTGPLSDECSAGGGASADAQPICDQSEESNISNQTVDYNLPFDPSFYYQNSFPRLLGQEAREEKAWASAFLNWLNGIMLDPQLQDYPLPLIKRFQELLRQVRRNSSPFCRPYFSEAISEIKILLERLAPFYLFVGMDSCVEFFTLQLQYDVDLHEIAIMWLEFLEKVISESTYRMSEQAVFRCSTLVQQLRSFQVRSKYEPQFAALVEECVSFVTCLFQNHEVKQMLELSSKLINDLATESKRGFDSTLIEDAVLSIIPMLALELHTISVPRMSSVSEDGRWNVVLEPFTFPTFSAIPQKVSVSTNHIFQVGLEHAKSETAKTLTILLQGIKPALLNVHYSATSLKGFKVNDAGVVDVQFPVGGVDAEVIFKIDASQPCPFELISCQVLIKSISVHFQQSFFPILTKWLHKKVERKIKRHLKLRLEEMLIQTCLALRKMTIGIRVKLLCWKSLKTSDEEINERISNELAEFFKALGLKKQDYEEARQQESFGTFENSSQDDEDLADVENLEFFPWASNKFSFKPHST